MDGSCSLSDGACYFGMLMAFIQAPWSLHKMVWIAVVVLGLIISYGLISINWREEFRLTPFRVAFTWRKYKREWFASMAVTAFGVIVGWYAWVDVYERHEISLWWLFPLGLLATVCGVSGAGATVMITLNLLFSPFIREKPRDLSGMDSVHRQQAYGDARTASAEEVHRAASGNAGGGPRREFED